MIESKDLRIGNFIKLDNELNRVASIYKYGACLDNNYYFNHICLYEKITPIELTPEILLKCGFTEGINKWYNLPYFTDNKESAEMFVITYNLVSNRLGVYEIDLEDTAVMCGKRFNYLHELQNWYRFQVGEELNVNL